MTAQFDSWFELYIKIKNKKLVPTLQIKRDNEVLNEVKFSGPC